MLEPREDRYFISMNVTFNETQMTMMCKDLEKSKKKVNFEVEPFDNESNYLEVSHNVVSNN